MEIDPDLKLELYTALTSRGLTLKEWFVNEAVALVENHQQPPLFVAARSGNGASDSGNGDRAHEDG